MVLRLLVFGPLLACLLLASVAESANSEVIGVWLDRVGKYWERTITILEEDDRLLEVSTFKDGSVVKRDLVEISPTKGQIRAFEIFDTTHGDACAIDSEGNLDLYDDEGFFRTANRVQK